MEQARDHVVREDDDVGGGCWEWNVIGGSWAQTTFLWPCIYKYKD